MSIHWRHDFRLKARNYRDPDDRKAFNAGYSDGFYDYPMWASNERNWHHNAYSAGFWEGTADREHNWETISGFRGLIDQCTVCGEERA